MSADETCPIEVADQGGFHWHKCGRPIKRDGMCGVHASAKERRARNDADRSAAFRERMRLRQEANERRAAGEAALIAVERVRALADRWAQEADERGPNDKVSTAGVAAMLHAALDAERGPLEVTP